MIVNKIAGKSLFWLSGKGTLVQKLSKVQYPKIPETEFFSIFRRSGLLPAETRVKID